MKLILINNSLDTFVYGDVTVDPESTLDVDPSLWFSLFKNLSFVSDIRLNNILVNDGIRSYQMAEAEAYVQNLISLNVPNRDVYGVPVVTTQTEKNDKDLKLARARADVDAETKTATILVKVPGVFGSGDGRYIAGGYGFTDVFHPDDYAKVHIVDEDRLIALAIAQAMDPEAEEPVSDEVVQGMGEYPNYPVVHGYTDDEAGEEHAGWWFWPISQGRDLDPIGEVEVEPIGGYGFVPSGFYVRVLVKRTIATGYVRTIFWWGKKG